MPEGPKKFEIFINGSKKTWNEETITYLQVVQLGFSRNPKANEIFTIDYTRGKPENREGTLAEGQSVQVKNGMAFDVTPSDRS